MTAEENPTIIWFFKNFVTCKSYLLKWSLHNCDTKFEKFIHSSHVAFLDFNSAALFGLHASSPTLALM